MRYLGRCMLAILGATGMSGCMPPERPVASLQPEPAAVAGYMWARSDGQRLTGSASLTVQARSDLSECGAPSPPPAAVGVPGETCMKERGYFIRPNG